MSQTKKTTKFSLFLEAQRKEINKYLKKNIGKKSRNQLASEWIKKNAKAFREKYYRIGIFERIFNYIKILYNKLF